MYWYEWVIPLGAILAAFVMVIEQVNRHKR